MRESDCGTYVIPYILTQHAHPAVLSHGTRSYKLKYLFMKLVSTFHPPSSVLDSLKCTLADENKSEFLVVAKLNRVDFYFLQPEGLRHERGIEIRGRIRAIRLVPIEVLLYSPQYSCCQRCLALLTALYENKLVGPHGSPRS